MTSSYALTNFEVQYWTDSAWATVPGGNVVGNDKVWRKFSFAALATSKIRVHVANVAGDNRSQVVEIEAHHRNVNWLVADQLGTPRMVFDQTGSFGATKRHDYLPFGEELYAGQGGRTTALGYAGDATRQKFTSKERDTETGLDYFLARYYSSTQGRFISVDPANADAEPDAPQSWNGYIYARNNPQLYTDPSGGKITICGPDGKTDCNDHSNQDMAQIRKNCAAIPGCQIKDDRLTGGRIIQDGEVIATFRNELDGMPGGELVTQLNGDEVWNRAAVGSIWNVTVGKVLGRVFRGRTSSSSNTPGLSKSAPRPLGRGNTGRTTPKNLKEQLAMEEAMSDPAGGIPVPLTKGMTDPRWPANHGWVKMRQHINGVEIHYVRNTRTGEVDDFKFNDPNK